MMQSTLVASSGALFVLVFLTAVTQFTQYELYSQQVHALQAGKGSEQLLVRMKQTRGSSPCNSEEGASQQSATAGTPRPMITASDVAGFHIRTSMCYMDELFHVPQIMRVSLLDNFFYYDPMITTPPGSYVLPIVSMHMLQRWNSADVAVREEKNPRGVEELLIAIRLIEGCQPVLHWSDILTDPSISNMWHALCGVLHHLAVTVDVVAGELFKSHLPSTYAEVVHFLRKENSGLQAIFWSWLILYMSNRTQQRQDVCWAILMCCIYPPLMFSATLVYTDVTSGIVVAYLICFSPTGLKRTLSTWSCFACFAKIALVGAFGIFVRQTNIVWLFYVSARFFGERMVTAISLPPPRLSLFKVACLAVVALTPCLFVAAGFVLFIVWNGGIVLGDKGSHEAVFHPAQIVYAFASFAVFFPCQTLRAVFKHSSKTRWLFSLAFTVFSLWSLTKNVWFHPYLMADNRHYTNVLYRKVLQSVWLRCALMTPLAVAGWHLFVFQLFGTTTTSQLPPGAKRPISTENPTITTTRIVFLRASAWNAVLLLLCMAMSCVPQKLIEFRYFVPVVMAVFLTNVSSGLSTSAVLRSSIGSNIPMVVDAMWLGVIHCATSYVFLYRTFLAPDGTIGRFMW